MIVTPPAAPGRQASGGLLLLAALLVVLIPRPSRAADRAVVVGVQRYALPGAQGLRGCVNDAKAMEETLTRRGFRVRRLLDAQATKAAVLQAIRDEGGKTKPNERFVFFFAGHGTNFAGFQNGRPAPPASFLLPFDADPRDAPGRFLSAKELADAVRAAPAASRTVILDACFSGGMSRSVMRKGPGRRATRARYWYPPFAGKSPVPAEANGTDAKSDMTSPGGGAGSAATGQAAPICYYTASKQDQKAYEGDYEAPHGIFTHALVAQLKKAPQQVVWSDLHTKISSEVSDASGMEQQPLLAPAQFLDKAPFANVAPPRRNPAALASLWEAFHRERPDQSALSLTITPNKKSFRVGEAFTLRVDLGAPGFLVLIEKYLDDNFYVLFPADLAVGAAYVDPTAPGSALDKGMRYTGDSPGAEVVKAFLFRSREDAAVLLKQFAGSKGVVTFEGAKRLNVVPAAQGDLFTSQLVFEITE